MDHHLQDTDHTCLVGRNDNDDMALARQIFVSSLCEPDPASSSQLVHPQHHQQLTWDLERALLTHKFESHAFVPHLWSPALQRLGWKYEASTQSYRAAAAVKGVGDNDETSDLERQDHHQQEQQPLVFATARDVQQFLDEPSLLEIHSNLQSTATTTTTDHQDDEDRNDDDAQNNNNDHQLAWKWRQRVLEELILVRNNNKKSGESEEKKSSDAEDAMDGEQPEEESTPRRRSSRLEHNKDDDDASQEAAPRRRNNNNNKTKKSNHTTVTALEKGTDLYLHRKSRKGRGKAKKNSHLNSALEAPNTLSLDDCARFQQALEASDEWKELEQEYATTRRRSESGEDENDENDERQQQQQQQEEEQFAQWRFLLTTNHSLLFYGSGSKRALLTQFANEELAKEGYTLLIDGFDESVTVDAILDLIVQLHLDGEEPLELPAVPLEDDDDKDIPVLGRSTPYRASPLVERGIAIGRAVAHAIVQADQHEDDNKDEEENLHAVLPLFLMIHNLEAPPFLSRQAQDALAALVVNSTVGNGVQAIRLVASIDHVAAPLHLWSTATAANFNWMYQPIHTHVPYSPLERAGLLAQEENKRRKAQASLLLTQNMQTVQASRVAEVLKHLAPRHAEVVIVLAQLQLEQRCGGGGNSGTKSNKWIPYADYLAACLKACLLTKDSQLRQLLTELADHGLVAQQIQGTSEMVQIPHNDQKLKEIIKLKK